MYIGICEDEQVQLQFLEQEIGVYCRKSGQEKRIESFESAEELLFKYEKDLPFDCLLLDIKMKQMDGMELAATIRKRDRRIPIIFVTGDRDAVFDGYKVGAVRYLLKPIHRNDLFEALDCVWKQENPNGNPGDKKSKRDFYCFQYEGDYVKLDKSNIYYIEVRGHYITLHTVCNGEKKQYIFKETLSGMKKQLGDERFVQAGRSVLVNLEHVDAITRSECVLSDGSKVAVSRSSYDGVNQAFILFYQ